MIDEYEPFKLLREELAKTAALFCRKITSFALLEEISELQGMCFSQNELMALNGQDLISSCQIMLDKTLDHRNDLIEYGIDEQFLNLFCGQMDKVKAVYHDEVTQECMNPTFVGLDALGEEMKKTFCDEKDNRFAETTLKE
jgi:hypothetical protein